MYTYNLLYTFVGVCSIIIIIIIYVLVTVNNKLKLILCMSFHVTEASTTMSCICLVASGTVVYNTESVCSISYLSRVLSHPANESLGILSIPTAHGTSRLYTSGSVAMRFKYLVLSTLGVQITATSPSSIYTSWLSISLLFGRWCKMMGMLTSTHTTTMTAPSRPSSTRCYCFTL